MIDLKKALLVALNEAYIQDITYVLDELEALAQTLQIEIVERFTQPENARNATTLIGEGKTQEIKDAIEHHQATMVIFFQELSNTQIRNLEALWDVVVLDRTLLIFELLAERARTKEAKLLVSIAQLEYLLPRLSALSVSFDRQQGGIGLKGPGETKLERSRRKIEATIQKRKKDLQKMVDVRARSRQQRRLSPDKNVALVGYTNAGKSTLLNRLLALNEWVDETKTVLVKDQVFSTLETQTRRIKHPNQPPFTLTDTIGFVSHLPKSLHKAFASTLEELKEADLILVVLDVSSPYLNEHIDATNTMLKLVGAEAIERLYVFNKADLATHPVYHGQTPSVLVSLKNDATCASLLSRLHPQLFHDYHVATYRIPYEKEALYHQLKTSAHILEEHTTESHRVVTVRVNPELHRRLSSYSH